MSRVHFSVVNEAFATLVAADLGGAEKLFDPAAEWHNTSVFPGDAVCTGPNAIFAFWQMLAEGFDDQASHEIERYAESHDRAVVGFHSLVSGRTSGAPLDVRWAALFEVNSQRVTRVDVFGSFEKASRALAAAPEPG